MKAVHAIISGRVQGVWYRAWTCRTAAELGLAGWVRNRRDGTVEAVFAGEESRVERMLAACRDGPPQARVENVSTEACAPPDGSDFVSRPTE